MNILLADVLKSQRPRAVAVLRHSRETFEEVCLRPTSGFPWAQVWSQTHKRLHSQSHKRLPLDAHEVVGELNRLLNLYIYIFL